MNSSRRLLTTLVKLADLSVIIASFIIAIAATDAQAGNSWWSILEMRIQLRNALFMAGYLGFWHFVMRTRGLYRSYRLSDPSREMREIGATVLMSVAPLVPLKPILGFHFVDIPFLLTFSFVAFCGLYLERRLLRTVGREVRRYGRNLRNVVVVGTGNAALTLASKLVQQEDLGYQVVEVISAGDYADPKGDGYAETAVLMRVEAQIEQNPVDELFIALPLDSSAALIQSLISLCEEQGITVRLMAQVASLYWARAVLDAIDGQPILTVHTGSPDNLALLVKRAIDMLGAALGLILLSPLLLAAAIVIKLDSPGPVFFRQERVGLNRRRFRAYKFRTMVGDAEKMQAALEPLNEAQGPVFKIENDPRITRVGKWLRHLSIDELPQLLNVLIGEMSLVGPRPLPVRDVNRIDIRWHKRRFSVKPGITCLWQVNSRQPKFDEWIQSDMEYIDNWSLSLDFKILAKTIPAVLSGEGAH